MYHMLNASSKDGDQPKYLSSLSSSFAICSQFSQESKVSLGGQ